MQKVFISILMRTVQAYIDHALMDDRVRNGVELTIPKMDEVKIFRTNPSLWWLPQPKSAVPAHYVAAENGPFIGHGFPQMVKKKFGIPYTVAKRRPHVPAGTARRDGENNQGIDFKSKKLSTSFLRKCLKIYSDMAVKAI